MVSSRTASAFLAQKARQTFPRINNLSLWVFKMVQCRSRRGRVNEGIAMRGARIGSATIH